MRGRPISSVRLPYAVAKTNWQPYDFDTIDELGFYTVVNNALAEQCIGLPEAQAGIVINAPSANNRNNQIFIPYTGDSMYFRCAGTQATGYGKWQKVATVTS